MSQTFQVNPWGMEMTVADPAEGLNHSFTYDEIVAIMFALRRKRDDLLASDTDTRYLRADYDKFLTAIGEKFGKLAGEDFEKF